MSDFLKIVVRAVITLGDHLPTHPPRAFWDFFAGGFLLVFICFGFKLCVEMVSILILFVNDFVF